MKSDNYYVALPSGTTHKQVMRAVERISSCVGLFEIAAHVSMEDNRQMKPVEEGTRRLACALDDTWEKLRS